MSALDVGLALTCDDNRSVVFGITLTFPNVFKTGTEARRFFNKTYFENLGADGLCRLVAKGRADLFSISYFFGEKEPEIKLAGLHSHYVHPGKTDACLRIVDGKSHLDILLGNSHAGSFQAEADFITKELNTYAEEGFVLMWEQFSLLTDV
ncbi:hypothetical protein HHX48_16070 [Salinimonas sp. HHU 13199]|uniref:Uncharacterized protein n=1 Tax=Salinimonas profundi TaxID=2729140 RepID=A0ABR8LNF9_9ALTE|nr:hypothetical protein [Salinimonas profundi]MBD3587257.1 hypothetical protein [Salinimonas profundi]